MKIELSDNYHADGGPRAVDRIRNYFIKIRKDKPLVLDFANKPRVLFASPAKDKTFKPGDEIQVKAVLIDPVCDFMIRGLDDSSRKKKEDYKLADGKEDLRKESLARSDRHDHRFFRQEGRRGPHALWLRRHLRVLVASTKGFETDRQERNLYRDRQLRHAGTLRQGRRVAEDRLDVEVSPVEESEGHGCHSERSEESPGHGEILRCAQDDTWRL